MGTVVIEKVEEVSISEYVDADMVSEVIEVAMLEEQVAQFKKTVLKEYERRKKALLDVLAAGLDPADGEVVQYGEYEVKITPAGVKRAVVDVAGVRAILGTTAFDKIVTVPLKYCDDYLTPEQRAVVLESSLTGPRRLAFTKTS